MYQFIDDGPDYERSSKARRGVLEIISYYRENSRKTTPDACIMKRPRFAEYPQPDASSGV
jgi:hypothetical protein